MWNKRKEDEFRPKANPAPAPSELLIKDGIPVSPMPTRGHDLESSRGMAVLGKSVMVKGQIQSREDLTIDGEVEGTVELQEHRLTIGPHGRVRAGIKAREIVVLGSIHGNVEVTDKIDIRKDAKLIGDIKTARIVIEDGAYFKGNIDITKPEVSKPAPPPPPPPQQPKPTATAPAAPLPTANQSLAASAGTESKR